MQNLQTDNSLERIPEVKEKVFFVNQPKRTRNNMRNT
jgi:hypothetical protein